MADIFIENIAALVKSATAPTKDDGDGNQVINTSVVWAKELDPLGNPALVQLLVYDFALADWVPLYNKATQILLGSVLDFLADPPADPSDEDAYIIIAPATDAWAGREGQIAQWNESDLEWDFQSPTKNSFALVIILETFYYYDGDYPTGAWNVALGGSAATFDGSRALKRVPVVGLVPGGTTQNQFLENLFYPFIPAEISLDNFQLQEVGENYDPPINGELTLNDEVTVTERRVIDVTGVQTLNNPAGNTIAYVAPTVAIIKGVVNQYKLEADVDNNGSPITIESPVRSVVGTYSYLVGMSDQNLGPTDIFSTLTRLLLGEQDILEVDLNGTNKFIYIAFDSDYDDLSDIKNNSDFSIINNFSKTLVDVESAGLDNDWVKEHKVYKLNNLTSPSGKYKFIR